MEKDVRKATSGPIITDQEIQDVAKLRRKGLTVEEIAAQLRIGYKRCERVIVMGQERTHPVHQEIIRKAWSTA